MFVKLESAELHCLKTRMSTSLKRQLAALAAPASSLLVPERRRSSILFTPDEAAKYDRETFYQIGQEGLEELISLNSILFWQFKESILFNELSKKFERAVEDLEVNKVLDEKIEQFLITLSPYLLLKPSLKCLEWLVHRFHIELFNVNAVLECILPYYDTKSFILVVQVLAIEKFQGNNEWEWLVPCIQSGAPLRKATLFSNSTAMFTSWIFDTFSMFVKIHKHNPENLRVYLGFLSSTLVGVLSKLKAEVVGNTNKIHRQKVIPVSILCKIYDLLETMELENKEEPQLGSASDEIYSMCLVVMAMIGILGKEIPEMSHAIGSGLKKIFRFFIKRRSSSQRTESFLLMNFLINFLNREWSFAHINALKTTLQDLSNLSQEWDLSALAFKLLIANVTEGVNLRPMRILAWIQRIQLNVDVRSSILREIYYRYRGKKSENRCAKSFLIEFEKQYPTEFEIACRGDPNLASDFAKCKSEKDCFILSQHPDSRIRAQAVKKLLKRFELQIRQSKGKPQGNKYTVKKAIIQELDQSRTATTLIPRFLDDSPAVLIELLKPKITQLKRIFTTSTIVNGAVSILKLRKNYKVKKLAVIKLCKVAEKLSQTDALKTKILAALFPLLFPRNIGQLKLAKITLKTKFIIQEDSFKQLYSALDVDKLTVEDLCKVSYTVIDNWKAANKCTIFGSTGTVSRMVYACLTMPANELLDTLNHGEIQFKSLKNLGFPINQSNFPECLRLAEKRNMLSLELIFTAFLRDEPKSFEDMLPKVEFAWKSAERLENRDIVMQFFLEYFKRNLQSVEEEKIFWGKALGHFYLKRSQAKSVEEIRESSFFLIRTSQFLKQLLAKLDSTKSTEAAESLKPDDDEKSHKPVTRSRAKDESSETDQSSKREKSRPKKTKNIPTPNQAEFEWTWNITLQLLCHGLTDNCQQIRQWSLECLTALKQFSNPKLVDFLAHVIRNRSKILLDHEQTSIVISNALSMEDFHIVKEIFVKTLSSPDVVEFKKLGMLNLCAGIGNQIFSELQGTVTTLMKKEPSSKYLLALLNLSDGSVADETLLMECLQHKEIAKVFLKKIDDAVFENLNQASKRKLFTLFVDKMLRCEIPEVKVSMQRCVRKWTLDASIVATELVKCAGMEKRFSVGSSSKQLEKPQSVKRIPLTSDEEWASRAEIVLEFVQGKKRINEKTKLIPPLFRILIICNKMEEQSPVEYLKQLVLTTLTDCCQEDEESNLVNDKDFLNFNVETIIDCLRGSRNPQTHHHALILLNHAAKRFQEQVLHGVMSLFTFMGNSILRQDDAYSTQLIQQTVVTIIPTLATAGKGGNSNLSRDIVSAGIYRVFTSAVQDIPVHRRQPVFSSLVETLDPETTMWQLCIIIVDNALQRDRKRSNLNADLELAVSLVWHFDAAIVSSTVEKMYSFLTSLPIYKREIKPEEYSVLVTRQSKMQNTVLDFGRKDSVREVLVVIHYVLELISQICAKFSELENQKLEYDILIDRCLTFSRLVSGLHEEKIFRLITHKNLEVIDKINLALDPLDFVQLVGLILIKDDCNVKKKVIEMLNQRVQQKVEWFGDLEVLLYIIPLLVEVASIEPESDEKTTLVQTALYSLKLLSRQLASSHPDEFTPVFHLASKQSRHENKLLRATAFLCMGELFCLKSLILPNLNEVTTSILKVFKASMKTQLLDDEIQEIGQKISTPAAMEEEQSKIAEHLLVTSTITCLNKMIEQLGTFVGAKFIKKSLIAVLSINSQLLSKGKDDNKRKQFDLRLKAVLKSVAAKIPLRNSLIPIKGSFAKLSGDTTSLCTLMKVLKDGLSNTTKPDFTVIIHSVMDSFLEDFLAYRDNVNVGGSDPEKDGISTVEDSVIDCLISGVVLKMSESSFRPIYHRIFDWAGTNTERLITFYRFSAAAAERLKSLFVTFAGYVINQAVTVLHQDSQLAHGILRFLFHIFSNDKEGFVTTDRFNALVKPLVDLMESSYVLDGEIAVTEINDTLIQLAVATNDLNRWQHLIELISFKSSHPNKCVRLHVLSLVEAAANELAKDFLPLLPPAVPFLAELMNDDDTEVEAETQKLLLKLEDIVGEPLQPYFTV